MNWFGMNGMQEKKDEFPHLPCKTLVTLETKQSCLYATSLGRQDRVWILEKHQLQPWEKKRGGRCPEPCSMADSVRTCRICACRAYSDWVLCTFCTEGGCKCVNIGQRCCVVLCLQLPRHRKESCLAKEVMAVVNATLFGPMQPSFDSGPTYNTSC